MLYFLVMSYLFFKFQRANACQFPINFQIYELCTLYDLKLRSIYRNSNVIRDSVGKTFAIQMVRT